MATKTSRSTTRCPLGVNGGEHPHWSIAHICNLAIKLARSSWSCRSAA